LFALTFVYSPTSKVAFSSLPLLIPSQQAAPRFHDLLILRLTHLTCLNISTTTSELLSQLQVYFTATRCAFASSSSTLDIFRLRYLNLCQHTSTSSRHTSTSTRLPTYHHLRQARLSSGTHHSANMDTLPPELKQRICNYLTPKDLKSFRLTSTDYAAAASRYLLPRIFLLNHPDSFQEVQDIVNHPELSQQVTTLVIDVCRLKQYPRYDHWARVFAAPSPASTDNQGSVEARAITTGDVDARSERILRREKNL